MPVQELAAITNIFEYAAQGCFEGESIFSKRLWFGFAPSFPLAANRS